MLLSKRARTLFVNGVFAVLAMPLGHAAAQPPAETVPRQVPSEFVEAVRSASRIAGIRFSSLMAQLAQESGFRTDARNPGSSATGPAQFLEATWLTMIRRYGAAYGLGHAARAITTATGRPDIPDPLLKAEVLALRQVPQLAAVMAARYLQTVSKDMQRLLGRRPSETETRMGYLLGAGGATQLLKAARHNPALPARDILPDAAQANPTLFNDATGVPLTVEACVSNLRQALAEDAEWSHHLEPPAPHEHIGDLVHGIGPVG